MHQNVVKIPQVNIGQVLGEDLLDLGIVVFAGVLVRFDSRPVNQGVDARVVVVLAVCPVGNNAGGVKGVFEEVGIFICAQPAQRIHLKFAMGDVGQKGGRFVAADIERDSNVTQLLL